MIDTEFDLGGISNSNYLQTAARNDYKQLIEGKLIQNIVHTRKKILRCLILF